MKIIFLSLIAIFCFLACTAQKKQMPNVSTSVRRNIEQQLNTDQVRPGQDFTDILILNSTNGDIPYIVKYLSYSYRSEVIAGHSEKIAPDEDCILIMPDGNFSLSKNRHYLLYLNNYKKVTVKQAYQ